MKKSIQKKSKKHKEDIYDCDRSFGFSAEPRKIAHITISSHKNVPKRETLEGIGKIQEIVRELHPIGDIENITIKFK